MYYWLGFAACLTGSGVVWSARHPGEGGRALLFVLNGSSAGLLCALLVGLGLVLLRTVRPTARESLAWSAVLGAATAGLLLVRGVRWYRLADEAGTLMAALAISAVILHLRAPRDPSRFHQPRALGIGTGTALFVFTVALAISAWTSLFGLGQPLPIYDRLHMFSITLLFAGYYAGMASIFFASGAMAGSLLSGSPRVPSWCCVASAILFTAFFLLLFDGDDEFSWTLGSPAWLLALPFPLGLGSLLLSRPRAPA